MMTTQFTTLGDTKMNKDIAKSLLLLSKSIDEVIVQMFAEIDKIEDQSLKFRFNKATGDLLGFVARDLIFPLENIYPELRGDSS